MFVNKHRRQRVESSDEVEEDSDVVIIDEKDAPSTSVTSDVAVKPAAVIPSTAGVVNAPPPPTGTPQPSQNVFVIKLEEFDIKDIVVKVSDLVQNKIEML